MVAIPGQLDLDPIAGAAPSSSVVAPTDFGLGEAGAQVESGAEALRRASVLKTRVQAIQDRQAAMPTVLKVQAANQADYETAVARGDAQQPGFVGDQYDNAMQRVTRAAGDPDLTPGQANEVRTMGTQHANAVAEAALNAHAAALAKPIAAATAAVQTGQIGDGLTSFLAAFEPVNQGLKLAHADGDTDLPQKTAAAFDDASAQAVAGAPAAVQPQLQLQLAGMRVKAVGEAQDFQLQHANSAVLNGAATQISTLANTVLSTPDSYANADSVTLPQIVQALPRGLQDAAINDGRAQLAVARVKGLIAAGHGDLAASELNRGDYDTIFKGKEKESLLSEVDAAARSTAPKSLDQAVAQQAILQSAEAERVALTTTGKSTGFDPSTMSGHVSYEEQAKILAGFTQARNDYAAGGSVRDMTMSQLQGVAHAGPPTDPTAPDYQAKLETYRIQQPAAQAELAARTQDPGGWAFNSNGRGAPMKGPGAAAVDISTDRGAALQQMWTNFQAAIGSSRAIAGGQYAGAMLGTQRAAGVPVNAQEIVPKSVAASLAASVTAAPPEGRLAALQSIASLISALPASYAAPDGSHPSPQGILQRQLLAAHMNPMDLSAILDFGSEADKDALGHYVAAVNNPTLTTPLPGAQGAILKANVRAALAPELNASAPLPGAEALNQARVDRTVLVARSLMAQGMGPTDAANAAAKDLTRGYRYVDTWRVPDAVASTWAVNAGGINDGAGQIRLGAARILADLTANHGANLHVPPGQVAYAAGLSASARWVTAPGETGLALMSAKTDGSWEQVSDKYGRPVTASWADLKAQNAGAPSMFATPPPQSHVAAAGGAIPAYSKASAFNSLARAVEWVESRGVTGRTSDQGALGVMQVLPSTAAPVAQRLFGAPLDTNRLLNDAAYNRKIGQQILADSINHYGASPGGMILSIANYIDGPGHVEGFTDARGYHPGLIQTLGDPRQPGVPADPWIARLPPHTQAYVKSVLPRAVHYLSGGN